MDTINSVLNVSRIEGGHVQIELKPIDLKVEMDELIALHAPCAQKQRLYIDYNHNAPNTPFIVDHNGFNQIFQSLLDKALKFTHLGGVTFRSFQIKKDDQDYIVISVKDTGIGMDENFMENALDPSKHESEGHKRAYEGSELGLSLVRKWTHLLHGQIELRNTRNHGTKFLVHIPRLQLRHLR